MSVRESFIDSLSLPEGIEIKCFEGMNRYHFKYYGIGFMVLEMRANAYRLRTKEKYLRGIQVYDYVLDSNHPTNPATVKNIPYDDTTVLYCIVDYIVQNSNNSNVRLLTLSDIKHDLVIIKINRSYYDGISPDELYEYTRGYWKRRIESVQCAKLALAVASGRVVEVYSIDRWVKAEQADNRIRDYDPVKHSDRIAFVGELASDEVRNYYIGRNVSPLYKNGEADPVKLFLVNGGPAYKDLGINDPVPPKSVNIIQGEKVFVCGRCGISFRESPRCPDCGQIVKR